jgi:hypothetical protein
LGSCRTGDSDNVFEAITSAAYQIFNVSCGPTAVLIRASSSSLC